MGTKSLKDSTFSKTVPLLCHLDGTIPSVPVRDNWVCDEVVDDRFWLGIKSRNKEARTPEGGNFICLYQDPTDKVLVNPNFLVRLPNERGDFPISKFDFASYSKEIAGWGAWVYHMLRDEEFVNILGQAGILDAIRLSERLGIVRDTRALRVLISRWNCSVHTFVTSWGEFTVTLEDVHALLLLPLFGEKDFRGIMLTTEEEKVTNFLQRSLAVSKEKPVYSTSTSGKEGATKRANFSGWIRFFFKEFGKEEGEETIGGGFHSGHTREAFIAFWLAKYVIPGAPCNGLHCRLFPLAVKLARGVKFALAPIYLGNLYHRLDLISKDLVRSMGRYVVQTFVDMSFLQMVLWERFRNYAPEVLPQGDNIESYHNDADGNEVMSYRHAHPRAWAWSNVSTKKKFIEVLDREEEFTFRPYLKSFPGYEEASFYPSGGVTKVSKATMTTYDMIWLAICYTKPLPIMIEASSFQSRKNVFRLTGYSPHRVMRQFGFDQGIPFTRPFSSSIELAFKQFIHDSELPMNPEMTKSFSLPSSIREGTYTPTFIRYWDACINCFKSFARETPAEFPIEPILKCDLTLKLPEKSKDPKSKGNGAKPLSRDGRNACQSKENGGQREMEKVREKDRRERKRGVESQPLHDTSAKKARYDNPPTKGVKDLMKVSSSSRIPFATSSGEKNKGKIPTNTRAPPATKRGGNGREQEPSLLDFDIGRFDSENSEHGLEDDASIEEELDPEDDCGLHVPLDPLDGVRFTLDNIPSETLADLEQPWGTISAPTSHGQGKKMKILESQKDSYLSETRPQEDIPRENEDSHNGARDFSTMGSDADSRSVGALGDKHHIENESHMVNCEITSPLIEVLHPSREGSGLATLRVDHSSFSPQLVQAEGVISSPQMNLGMSPRPDQNTSYFPPQVEGGTPMVVSAATSQPCFVNFRGGQIDVKFQPLLEALLRNHRNIFSDSVVKTPLMLNSLYDCLGQMMVLFSQRHVDSLKEEEFDFLIESFSDLKGLGLKVDWMEPYIEKCIKFKECVISQHKVEKIRGHLEVAKARVTALNNELKNAEEYAHSIRHQIKKSGDNHIFPEGLLL